MTIHALSSFAPASAEPSLDDIVHQRILAKREEDAAVERRRALDMLIAERLADPTKPEGSVTRKTGEFKVSVSFGVTRKVDTPAVQAAWEALPAEVKEVFKWKAEVVTAELRKLEASDLARAGKFITTTPSTPSIKIEAV
jgi:hypothetical protein